MKSRAVFSRPYGTQDPRGPEIPAINRWAIDVSSLRDEDLWDDDLQRKVCATLVTVSGNLKRTTSHRAVKDSDPC